MIQPNTEQLVKAEVAKRVLTLPESTDEALTTEELESLFDPEPMPEALRKIIHSSVAFEQWNEMAGLLAEPLETFVSQPHGREGKRNVPFTKIFELLSRHKFQTLAGGTVAVAAVIALTITILQPKPGESEIGPRDRSGEPHVTHMSNEVPYDETLDDGGKVDQTLLSSSSQPEPPGANEITLNFSADSDAQIGGVLLSVLGPSGQEATLALTQKLEDALKAKQTVTLTTLELHQLDTEISTALSSDSTWSSNSTEDLAAFEERVKDASERLSLTSSLAAIAVNASKTTLPKKSEEEDPIIHNPTIQGFDLGTFHGFAPIECEGDQRGCFDKPEQK